jgi:hypothetical protein
MKAVSDYVRLQSLFAFILALFLFISTAEVEGFAPGHSIFSKRPSHDSASSNSPRLDASKSGASSFGQVDDASDDDTDLDMDAFKARKKQQEIEAEENFDGYALRDIIFEKWGKFYDVEFNRVDSFGFRSLYLNVLPFHLGGRKFRHETELDYLCHLQAVVEILEKYDQIGYILAQIDETNKKPRAGTSPLVAVPLRLELTREQVTEIIGY